MQEAWTYSTSAVKREGASDGATIGASRAFGSSPAVSRGCCAGSFATTAAPSAVTRINVFVAARTVSRIVLEGIPVQQRREGTKNGVPDNLLSTLSLKTLELAWTRGAFVRLDEIRPTQSHFEETVLLPFAHSFCRRANRPCREAREKRNSTRR